MPGANVNADLWITEYLNPWTSMAHGIVRIYAHRRTDFQDMYIVESGAYGKGLVLDGKWQSCVSDEFLYHEPLVHVAALQHGAPRRVLILGGGEGATVREVLRWRGVERVTMVDIDGEVVAACKEHLPEMHQGAFDDQRTELVIGDAVAFLDSAKPEWDVVISDLSDPIEEGPSYRLFTREYFERAQRALAPGGYFVLQAGPTSPMELKPHARLCKTLETVFENVHSYSSFVPSYGQPWGFALASDVAIDPRPDPATVDAHLAESTTGGFRFLDGQTLLGLLQTARHVREEIASETRVYTLDQPPKFFGRPQKPDA